MGILNLNEDSFYAESRFPSPDMALRRVEKMLEEGADIIDLGAASTRPGAPLIQPEEEIKRLLPTLSLIQKHFPGCLISIDTYHAATAREALKQGVHMINDISAGRFDPTLWQVVSAYPVPYVLMHGRGTPDTMQTLTHYDDLWEDLLQFFAYHIHHLHSLNINDIILDPGIGFAKTVEQNFLIMSHLERLAIFKKPILVGISRKSFIYKTLQSTPEEALNGSTVMHTLALLKQANILRVHDVRPAREIILLLQKIQTSCC